jgi:hypothetical protein
MNKLFCCIYSNLKFLKPECSYLVMSIMAIVFFLSLIFLGCTGPPIPLQQTPEPSVSGAVIISNVGKHYFWIEVFDAKENIVFADSLKPHETKKPLTLRAGTYKFCVKGGCFWSQIWIAGWHYHKCAERTVAVGKEHHWQVYDHGLPVGVGIVK